jgi:hypothetical protein
MANKFFKAYKFLTGGKSKPGIVGVKPKSGGAADEFKARKLKDMGKKMRKLKSQDKEMGEAIKDAKKKGVARKDLVGGRKIQRDSRRLQREGDKLRKDVLRVGKKDGGSLKPVDKKKNPGLAKLPTQVRNKMGYMKKGGRVKKFGGGKK